MASQATIRLAALRPEFAPVGTVGLGSSDDGDDGGVTSLQKRVLDYYTENGTCTTNSVAASLGLDIGQVKAAVEFLSSEHHLHSTIDEDHHGSIYLPKSPTTVHSRLSYLYCTYPTASPGSLRVGSHGAFTERREQGRRAQKASMSFVIVSAVRNSPFSALLAPKASTTSAGSSHGATAISPCGSTRAVRGGGSVRRHDRREQKNSSILFALCSVISKPAAVASRANLATCVELDQ